MSDQTYSDGHYLIRCQLLSTPGARKCPYCEVITQGDNPGLIAHMAACHPELVTRLA